MIDIEKLINVLSEYLKDKEEVIAAYIYGSIASGAGGKQSDLDIALLTHPFRDKMESQKSRIHYLHEIQRLVEMDIDLVFLQDAGELLAYQILKKGRLVFERDKKSHVSFKTSKIIQCLDFKPIERRMQKGLLVRMRRERHG